MSVTSTTRKAGPYPNATNSSTTDFPFTFKVFQAVDLLVVQTDNSPTPADTTLTLNTHYTVTLNANQDSNPGGKVTLLTALPSGYLLTIGSQVAETQGTTLTNTGGFYPTVINSALDYLTILIQQVSEKLSRALVMPFSTNASGQLPPVSPGSLLGWKADGTGIDNVGATGVGAGGIVSTNMAAGATGIALSTDTQAATTKATPADADEMPLFDSAATPAFSLKSLSWANLKATIASFIGSLLNMTGAINYARTIVASAATPDIWTGTGNVIDYTGTATATDFAAAPQAGASRILDCAGACSFTAGVNMLIDGVPSGTTLYVQAGDRIEVLARTATQFVLTLRRVAGVPGLGGAVKNYSGMAIGINNYNQVISADEAILENSAQQYFVARNFSLTIDANGVVGNPLSIMSARAASTWYYVWLWYNATLGLAATLDASSTAPTAPAGYAAADYNARMPGAVRTDSSAGTYLLQTKTLGHLTQYVVLSGSNTANYPSPISGTQGDTTIPTYIIAAIGAYVPPIAKKVRGILVVPAGSTALISPNNQTGNSVAFQNPGGILVAPGSSARHFTPFAWLLEDMNFYYIGNSINCGAFITGWES